MISNLIKKSIKQSITTLQHRNIRTNKHKKIPKISKIRDTQIIVIDNCEKMFEKICTRHLIYIKNK